MGMNVTTKSFRDFCPKCASYQEQTGVCTKIFENVREYPKKFIKKCNGDYFTYDFDKLGDAVEMEVKEPNAKTEKNEFNQIQTSAGFWVRSGSVILDGLILLLISAFFLSLVIVPFSPIIPVETYLKFVFMFLPLVFLFYLAWINADGRHSPGKMLFGLAVVDTSYKRISFSRSLRRTLVSFFDLPGLLFILLNRKRQALHDMLAKTYVIRVNQPQRLEKLFIVVIVIGGSYLASVLSRYIDSYTQAFRIPTASENGALIASEAHFEIKFMKIPEVAENLVRKIDSAIYEVKMAAKSKGSFQNQNIPSKSDSVLGIGLNSGLLFDPGGYQHPLLNNLTNYFDRNDGTVIFLVMKSGIDSVKALLYSNYGKNYPELNRITRDIVGTNTDILLGNTKLKKLRRFYTLNFCEIESILSDKFISEAKIEYRLQVLPQFKYEPIIKIRLDETGTKEWKRITSENIGKRIAVILNNNWVYDTNFISKIDTTGEIEFSGLRSNSEAERLALALNKKHQNH